MDTHGTRGDGTGRGGAAQSRQLALHLSRRLTPPGRRVDLVPLQPGHAEEMAGVLNDPALHAFIGGEPLPADALRARYERLAGGSPDPGVVWANWVVRLRGPGRLIGTVQATVTPERALAELAWIIGTPWQGRGFATEAARILAGFLADVPIGRLVAHVHPDHAASAAVAAACGLRPTPYHQDGEVRWESGAADRGQTASGPVPLRQGRDRIGEGGAQFGWSEHFGVRAHAEQVADRDGR